MCKSILKWDLDWVLYRRLIYWRPSIFIFVLCSVYLVEFTLNPNSMIEIEPELWPQGHCSSPMLAFVMQKPGLLPPINQSIDSIFYLQAAAFMPFFRAHAHLDTKRREPWLQPAEHLEAIRESIVARYRLLPYWYTLFYSSSLNGHPLVKPLWVELPHDATTFAVEDEFFVGE